MEFVAAVGRLTHLLAGIHWPVEIEWVEPGHVLHVPRRVTVVFRQQSRRAENLARTLFQERYGRAPAISFYACGHDGTRTYAFVEAIEELAQGEGMFVSDGLKISSQADESKTHVTSSPFWWWFHRRAYRKWERSIERSLAGG